MRRVSVHDFVRQAAIQVSGWRDTDPHPLALVFDGTAYLMAQFLLSRKPLLLVRQSSEWSRHGTCSRTR
jgi:hypothetical protein